MPTYPTLERGAPAQLGARRRLAAHESHHADPAPPRSPARWHLEPPAGSIPVHAIGRFDLLTGLAAGDQEELAILKAQSTEVVVIHAFQLVGFEIRDSLDFPGQTEYRPMPSHTTFDKLFWGLYSSDASLVHFGGGGEASPKGFRTLEAYSVRKGNTSPVVVQPGHRVRLVLTGIDPAAGVDYSSLGAYVEGRLSGYRVPLSSL